MLLAMLVGFFLTDAECLRELSSTKEIYLQPTHTAANKNVSFITQKIKKKMWRVSSISTKFTDSLTFIIHSIKIKLSFMNE